MRNFEMFSKEEIGDFIVTALEGGSNYWIDHIVFSRIGDCSEDTKYYDIPMSGGVIKIQEFDVEHGPVSLDSESLQRGLDILREKYPWHYKDLIKEDYDAETGDAFLQCCVLGDIVYG